MTLDDQIRDVVKKAISDELGDLRRAVTELKDSIRTSQPASVASEYASADEAAKLAGVKPQTVRRWIARGQLRGHRAGRLVRVRVDELRAFLDKQGGGAPDPQDDGVLAFRLFGK